MARKHLLNKVISTDLPLSEVWNSLLTPDPFPGNLFIDDGTTYVCYPLGTGRIGGYRFEYGKHKWMIMRLTSADLHSQRIRWDLVDIKSSPIRVFELSLELNNAEAQTHVHINLSVEFAFWANYFRFFIKRGIRQRLATLAI